MLYKTIYSFFLFVFCWNLSFGQEVVKNAKKPKDSIKVIEEKLDPLSPARAAFYSAVLPGLGQAYNKKYWKMPIVYGAIGTGVYFYIDNKEQYERYQTAYKLRLSGRDDEFNGVDGNPNISADGLVRAQKILKKNRDLSLFVTIGLYALNIIEANVDAHLDDRAFSKDLSFRPILYVNPIDNKTVSGLSLTFDF